MNDSRDAEVDGLVVVGRFPTIMEANLAASRLDVEGIEAEVEPNAAYEIVSYTQFMGRSGGVGVLVPQSQSEKARAVLEELQKERLANAPAETDLERRSRLTLVMSIFALVGFLVFPPGPPLMFLRIRQVRRDFAAAKDTLPPETERRIKADLATSTVISGIGCALLVVALGAILVALSR